MYYLDNFRQNRYAVATITAIMLFLSTPSIGTNVGAKHTKKSPKKAQHTTNTNPIIDGDEPSMVGYYDIRCQFKDTVTIPDSGFKESETIYLKHGTKCGDLEWYRTTPELSQLSCHMIVYDTTKVQINCDKTVPRSEFGRDFYFEYNEYTSRNEGHYDDSSGRHYYVELLMHNGGKVRRRSRVANLLLLVSSFRYCLAAYSKKQIVVCCSSNYSVLTHTAQREIGKGHKRRGCHYSHALLFPWTLRLFPWRIMFLAF